MIKEKKDILKTCKKGHKLYKRSDCTTCPVCEKERRPKTGLLSQLSTPAIRALENAGIQNAQDVANYTKDEILALHGIGPSSLPVIEKELEKHGLTFKNKKE